MDLVYDPAYLRSHKVDGDDLLTTPCDREDRVAMDNTELNHLIGTSSPIQRFNMTLYNLLWEHCRNRSEMQPKTCKRNCCYERNHSKSNIAEIRTV